MGRSKFILHYPSTSEFEIQYVVQKFNMSSREMISISSAEGVALGRVQGGHLEAAPHAGARPLAHHGLQQEGPGLIVLSLLLLPLVSQSRLKVEAGGQRRLGVLQADGKRRQLQQVILKFIRLFSI